MSEVLVVMVMRVRGSTHVATCFAVRSEGCLTSAAELLSLARVGTRVTLEPRWGGGGRWEGHATGRPCTWLVAEQRRRDKLQGW